MHDKEPGSIRFEPVEFTGVHHMPDKWGGNKTLLAATPAAGMLLSAWSPPVRDTASWQKLALMAMQRAGVVVVVVDTNREGLPALSVHFQPVNTSLAGNSPPRSGAMATPRHKIIVPPGFKR